MRTLYTVQAIELAFGVQERWGYTWLKYVATHNELKKVLCSQPDAFLLPIQLKQSDELDACQIMWAGGTVGEEQVVVILQGLIRAVQQRYGPDVVLPITGYTLVD